MRSSRMVHLPGYLLERSTRSFLDIIVVVLALVLGATNQCQSGAEEELRSPHIRSSHHPLRNPLPGVKPESGARQRDGDRILAQRHQQVRDTKVADQSTPQVIAGKGASRRRDGAHQKSGAGCLSVEPREDPARRTAQDGSSGERPWFDPIRHDWELVQEHLPDGSDDEERAGAVAGQEIGDRSGWFGRSRPGQVCTQLRGSGHAPQPGSGAELSRAQQVGHG